MSIQMQNGLEASIEVSRVNPVAVRSVKLTQKNSIFLVNSGTLEMTEIKASGKTLQTPGVSDAEFTNLRHWNVDKKDALFEETLAFLTAVQMGAPMPVPWSEAFDVMAWIHEIELRLNSKKI